MGFWSDIFGGGSSTQEQNLANSQANFAQTMQNSFSQQFGAQSGIMKNLNQQLTPVANLGPNQQGFSSAELSAMNSAAINNAGAAARNAQQSTGAVLAGQGGGGGSGLVSGIEAQIRGSEASAAANELAGAQNQIVQNNYVTGRQNFWQATAGENALAKDYNPEAFASEATTANNQAFNQADKIQQEKGSVLGDIGKIVGLGGSLIGGALTGGVSNVLAGGANAGSETGGGAEQFFSGAVDALGNQ